MRVYELCLIVHADVTEEGLQSLLDSIGSIIEKNKGSLVNIEQWGKKNFKYAIKKQTKGLYCFITFRGDNAALREIDRSIRYNEQILRYDTILQPKKAAVPPAAAPVATPPQTDSDTDQPEPVQPPEAVPENNNADAPAAQ